jgi:hypothetical protein
MPWLSPFLPSEGLSLYAQAAGGLLRVAMTRPGGRALAASWDGSWWSTEGGVCALAFSDLAAGVVSPCGAAWVDGVLSDPSGLEAVVSVMGS